MDYTKWLVIAIILTVIALVSYFTIKNFVDSTSNNKNTIMEFTYKIETPDEPIILEYSSESPIEVVTILPDTQTVTTTYPATTQGEILIQPNAAQSAGKDFNFQINNPRLGVQSISSIRTSSRRALNTGNVMTSCRVINGNYLNSLVFENQALSSITFVNAPLLNNLVLTNNVVETIDTTKLTNLETLKLDDNRLTSLDLSFNQKLISLDISTNSGLSSVNLTNCSKLETLIAEDVNTDNSGKVFIEGIETLTSIKNITSSSLEPSQINSLPNKTSFTTLNLNNSGLNNGDINFNEYVNLTSLNIGNNSLLTSLDISALTKLEELIINDTSISSIDVTNNILTKLNVSNTPSISIIGIENTNLTEFNFESSGYNPDFSQSYFSNLTNINGINNGITSVDFTNLTQLQYFNYTQNYIISISNITSLNNIQNIIFFNMNNNGLDLTTVNTIFNTINSFGTSNGVIDLANNTTPSNDSLISRNDLISRGWLLFYDS